MWKVVEKIGVDRKMRPIVLAECPVCKKVCKRGYYNLKYSASCGCGRIKHGMWKTKIYRVWYDMNRRCYDKKDRHYAVWGGRGIVVCDRWKDLTSFVSDMGKTYQPGLTLDRIDNNGNYDIANCRWVSRTVQANNRRSNRIIEYMGGKYTLADICRLNGSNQYAVWKRLKRGWDIESAIKVPMLKPGRGKVPKDLSCCK